MTIDPEAEFPKMEKILYDVAWKKARTNGMDFEELKSESFVAFVKACERFNPAEGMKLSSWVYFWADHHLRDVVRNEYKKRQCFSDTFRDDVFLYTHARTPFLDVLATLSETARQLLNLILENQVNKDGQKMSHIQLLARSMERMVELGHRRWRVEKARMEIRDKLRQVWQDPNPDHVCIEGMTSPVRSSEAGGVSMFRHGFEEVSHD